MKASSQPLHHRSISTVRHLVCFQEIPLRTRREPANWTSSARTIRCRASRCSLAVTSTRCAAAPHRRDFHSSSKLLHTPSEPMSWYNLGQYVMDMVHLTHDMTGASYATSICAITVAGRLALSPLVIKSIKNNSRRDLVLPKLEALHRQKRATRNAVEALYASYGYKPSQRFVLPVATLTLTVGIWYGLRWMGFYYPDEMSTGGLLWFVDLAEPDPLRFLPILSASSFFAMGELDADHMGRPMEQSVRMRWFLRTLRGAAFFVLIDVPASVHCFWIPNAFLSIAQTVVLSQPSTLTRLGIGERKQNDEITLIKDVLKVETRGDKPPHITRKKDGVNPARGKQGKTKKGKRRR